MFKKVMSIVLSIVMALSMFTMVSAEPVYDCCDETAFFSDYDVEATKEETARICEIGKDAIANKGKTRGRITTLSIGYLCQEDDNWKSVSMLGCKCVEPCKIGPKGCKLTSFTMIKNYIKGTNDTPPDVNTKYYNSTLSAVCYMSASRACSVYSMQHSAYYGNDYENFIVGSLEQGRPVMLQLERGTNIYHYIVAYGWDETFNGDISILTRDTSKFYDYNSLDEALTDTDYNWELTYSGSMW